MTGSQDASLADLDDPGLYINRELSQLAFIRRVLAVAESGATPLLERLRFLCITASVLDEFYEIRVAGLKQQILHGWHSRRPDGIPARELQRLISCESKEIVLRQYSLLNDVLIPALAKEEICILRRPEWNEDQKAWLKDYFDREIYPILTPQSLDPAHPFPRVVNKILNFYIQLDGKDGFGRAISSAVLHAPRSLPRVIRLPEEVSTHADDFVFLSSIIHEFVGELFPGMRIRGCHQYRVTRNSDLLVEDEEAEDLRLALEGELLARNWGSAVRLECADLTPGEVSTFLLSKFQLEKEDLFVVKGPVNLSRLSTIPDLVDRADLVFPTFHPGVPKALLGHGDLFEVLREQDLLLHHPYQSFLPFVEWVQQAARDPQVLLIKQTLYRTEKNSPLIEALIQAARAGKEVTVVIELRARFDEQTNIDLAERLQEAGAYVSYGIVGYKAHAKMTLIVRKEGDLLKRYVHLGTGNYHSSNAKSYSDFGLMTADTRICGDVHKVFQQLTSLGKPRKLKALLQSPFTLHESLLAFIDKETENALEGKPARILAKVNALSENRIMKALYRASQAGVEVRLIVRGICCLRPGIPGISENIEVRSIVGRFLEHHRVYYFENAGAPRLYCSSADWMDRNLLRRVETCFPIQGKKQFRRVFWEGLDVYLEDEELAWILDADGMYAQRPVQSGTSSQDRLLEALAEE